MTGCRTATQGMFATQAMYAKLQHRQCMQHCNATLQHSQCMQHGQCMYRCTINKKEVFVHKKKESYEIKAKHDLLKSNYQ